MDVFVHLDKSCVHLRRGHCSFFRAGSAQELHRPETLINLSRRCFVIGIGRIFEVFFFIMAFSLVSRPCLTGTTNEAKSL
jgi:hypothetical protein